MTATRATLKQYFRQYATPTEAQFAALIDSFVHKDEDSLTQSKIDGLVAALDGKVSTNQVNTMVASKVTEILSDPNFAAAPTAHSHVAADVEGLSAFITRVTNFLDSADVSDTTINRWKEIETFLTGITDQETLAGLLLQLKNEITALIPAPAPTNYLKQISDLDAYTTAQEGEIVQYVGSTTAKYTRGWCYENKGRSGKKYISLGVFTFDNCSVKTYQNSSARYLFPEDCSEVISLLGILPKIYTVTHNGSQYYGLYFDKERIFPTRVSYTMVFGNKAISQCFDSSGNAVNISISSGSIYFPTDHGTENAVNFTEDTLDKCCFYVGYGTPQLSLCKKIQGTELVLTTNAYSGDYFDFSGTSSLKGFTDSAETQDYSGSIEVAQYQIGGWQPIVTSPTIS